MIAGILGLDPEDDKISDQEWEEACQDAVDPNKGLLRGRFIECHNRTIMTRAKGQPFTTIKYVREVSPQEVRDMLPEGTEERLFPNGELETLIGHPA